MGYLFSTETLINEFIFSVLLKILPIGTIRTSVSFIWLIRFPRFKAQQLGIDIRQQLFLDQLTENPPVKRVYHYVFFHQ